jgi:hypothetical protein
VLFHRWDKSVLPNSLAVTLPATGCSGSAWPSLRRGEASVRFEGTTV